MFLVAYFLRYESDLVILAVFVVFSALVLGALRWAGSTSWRAHSGRALPLLSAMIQRLRAPPSQVLQRATTHIMAICICAYAVISVLGAGRIGLDLVLLSITLLIAVLFTTLRAGNPALWLERVIAYTAVVMLVYLDQTSALVDSRWRTVGWVLFATIGAAALLRFVFARSRGFAVTSLDLLVVFVAIVVPLLPGPVQISPAISAGVAKTVVILYAVELLLDGEMSRRIPRMVFALTFAAVALRGVFAFGS